MFKNRLTRSFLLVFVALAILAGTVLPASAELMPKPLDGKTISILGDSISTFENVSCGNASKTTNSTIKNNRLYFTDGRLGVGLNDTWWMQGIDALGGELLVNNSYSNSVVYDPTNTDSSQAYIDRCINLHDNTGENAGQEPDIILIYVGINDFSYHKDALGSFSDIDFNALINESNGTVTYAEPTSTCEAYAIMLHKIKARYQDSEIFCFNFPEKKNLSSDDISIFAGYNDSIALLCDYFGCNLVDLYTVFSDSRISSDLYFYDGIHPNKNGMDAITNAFTDAFYKYSRYSDSSIPTYTIEYNTNGVIATSGKRYAVREHDSLYCKFNSPDGAPVTISLTVNGADLTEEYVYKNLVSIPDVTGNVVINASPTQYSNNSHGITIENDILTFINEEEFSETTAGLVCGNIENGTLNNALIEFDKAIELKASEPWSLVWRCAYASNDNVFTFNNYSSSTEEGNTYVKLDVNNNTLTIGRYTNGSTYSYGIDLSSYDINFNVTHTYRLHNNITDNTVYLYIDGKKIDALSNYYVDDIIQKTSYNNFSFFNVYLNNIGSEEALINGVTLEYIKAWESEIPESHKHNYIYNCTYELSCTEDERTESVCDCGGKISEITAYAQGHKESHWLTSKTATVHTSGSAYKQCEVCGKLLQSKILPQLQPAAPKIYSISNKINGIKIDWYSVNGADSYRVYRRGAGEGYWTYIATTTSTTYLDTTATNNAYWRYTVRAGNEAGYGTYDNNGKYIKYVSPPHVLTLENVTAGIQIKWSKVYGATGYRVYRCRLGYTSWTYVATTTTTTYIDKNIARADGVYYKYTIRAVNCYYSDFETDTQYIKRLSTPTLLQAKQYRYGIEVKWQPVVGTTGYYVYRKTATSGWVCIGSVGGTNNTTFVDTKITNGVKYTYTVRACYGKYLSSYNSTGVSNKK